MGIHSVWVHHEFSLVDDYGLLVRLMVVIHTLRLFLVSGEKRLFLVSGKKRHFFNLWEKETFNKILTSGKKRLSSGKKRQRLIQIIK